MGAQSVRIGTREIVQLQRRENAACASGIHTLHTRPPRSNYSPGAGKVQGACAAPCQTRVISRSEKSRKGRLETHARLCSFKDVRMRHAQVAFTLYTLPPRSSYSPGAGKVQGACAAMPNSRHPVALQKSREGRLE